MNKNYLIMGIILIITSFIANALPYGAVAQWDYNESSTPFIDNWNGYKLHWTGLYQRTGIYPNFNVSGNGQSYSSRTTGVAGYGLNNDVLGNESLTATSSDFTIQTWVNQNITTNGGYFFRDSSVKTGMRFDNDKFQTWVFGGGSMYHGSVIQVDTWYFTGIKCNSGTCYAYWGGGADELQNVSITPGSDAMGNGVYWGGSTSNSLIGSLDRSQIFNTTLSWSDIKEYYNNGYVEETVITSSIDLLFSNMTNSNIYKNIFGESENLRGYINWTDENNNPLNNSVGSCNLSFENGLIENESLIKNYTVCSSGCTYTNSFTEQLSLNNNSFSIPVNDTIIVDVCHDNLAIGGLTVSIECKHGTDQRIFTANEFPACNLGSAKIIFESPLCRNRTDINYTVEYIGTNNKAKRIYEVEFDREFEILLKQSDKGEIIYNSSIDLWQSSSSVEYYEHGTKNVYANCSHTTNPLLYSDSTLETLTIVNSPPLITFGGIKNDAGFFLDVNNSNITFADGDWLFFGSVVDDDLSFVNLTFRNSTNIIFSIASYNFTPGFINLSSKVFDSFTGNPYTASLYANDTQGAQSYSLITFNVIDIISPYCTGLDDISIINNSVYTWNIICTDENFFSFNLSCSNGISEYQEGLNQPLYTYTNSTTITQNINCSYYYCDGHTINELSKKWYARYYDNKIEFDIGDKQNILRVDGMNVTFNYTRIKDRYTFDVIPKINDKDKDKIKDKYNNNQITFYYTVNPGSYYLKSDKYTAWIVDPISETWFDLNTDEPIFKKINVQAWNETTFIITMHLKDNLTNDQLTKIKFKSIGELNCRGGVQEIKAITLLDNSGWGIFNDGTCPLEQSTGFVIGFIAIVIFLIFIMSWNAKTIDYPFVNFFVGLAFIGVSVSIYYCSVFMSIPIGFFGILIWLVELSGINSN